MDADDLDRGELARYGDICGRTLARAHARSDQDTGIASGNAEKRILATPDRALFVSDIARFARAASRRILEDYEYLDDHERGAFELVRGTG